MVCTRAPWQQCKQGRHCAMVTPIRLVMMYMQEQVQQASWKAQNFAKIIFVIVSSCLADARLSWSFLGNWNCITANSTSAICERALHKLLLLFKANLPITVCASIAAHRTDNTPCFFLLLHCRTLVSGLVCSHRSANGQTHITKVQYGISSAQLLNANTNTTRRFSSALPNHLVVGLPALSPTMEIGTISEWKVRYLENFQCLKHCFLWSL